MRDPYTDGSDPPETSGTPTEIHYEDNGHRVITVWCPQENRNWEEYLPEGAELKSIREDA